MQLTCPVPPAGGVLQFQPAEAENDWNAVDIGTEVVRVKLAASFGPLFVTLIAYETVLPLTTVLELGVMVTDKFAPGSAKGFTMPVYAYLCCK